VTTTLTDDELWRIKREVIDNVLDNGASPYIGVRSIYDVIQSYVLSSSVASTTSATAVTAAGPTVLTLASITGFVAPQRVVLDVDDARETVTIRVVVASTISVVATKTHSGTYPVEVESALTLVRGLLSDLVNVEQRVRGSYQTAGVRKVDEIEFFGGAGEQTVLTAIQSERSRIRNELAEACGIGWIYRHGIARRTSTAFETY